MGLARARRLPWGPLGTRGAGVVTSAPAAVLLGLMAAFPLSCFLLLAWSPRLFDQGTPWFTLSSFRDTFTGPGFRALVNTLIVGTGAALLAVAVALPLTWMLLRTQLLGRQLLLPLVWGQLLVPTYLSAFGWELLVQRNGPLGLIVGSDPVVLRHLVMGPLGVIWILGARGVAFAYLALAGSVRALGIEYEDSVRVHGGTHLAVLRMRAVLLSPALWSGAAIVFAESISDFGVAATLAADAHFPVATFAIYAETSNLPIDFPAAAATSWALLALVVLAVAAQARALRGRTFAALSGRSRLRAPSPLSLRAQVGAVAGTLGFFLLTLGIPLMGLATASMLVPSADGVGNPIFGLANYTRVLSDSSLIAPALLSLRLTLVAASLALVLGFGVAYPTVRPGNPRGTAVLDVILLAAVGIPSIVVGASMIFAYNLPVLGDVGVHLYGTQELLVIGYIVGFAPIVARLLTGPIAQLSRNLLDAARVHGMDATSAWFRVVLPVLAPSIVNAWLFAFSAVAFELPLSDILHPPGVEPLAVAITKQMRFDFGGGTALMGLSVVGILAIVAAVLGAFRLLAPRSWRRLDAADRSIHNKAFPVPVIISTPTSH